MIQSKKSPRAAEVCNCNHAAPGAFTFTSPAFSQETAQRAKALGLSGIKLWNFCVEELGDHHAGTLTDHEKKPFLFREDVTRYDDAIRDCHKGHINKILKKADPAWEGKNALQDRMIYTMLVLYFALENYDCRTQGACFECANEAA